MAAYRVSKCVFNSRKLLGISSKNSQCFLTFRTLISCRGFDKLLSTRLSYTPCVFENSNVSLNFWQALHLQSAIKKDKSHSSHFQSVKKMTPSLVLHRRCQTTQHLSENDVRKCIEQISDQFAEAREFLEDAKEVQETVYFEEDMQEAQEAVEKTLKNYEELLLKLSPEQQKNVKRTIGLKMEELRAQLDMIQESLKE